MNLAKASLFSLILVTASCGEATRHAEENLDILRRKAEALDSIILVETHKLNHLDSVINTEIRKSVMLDSIINSESKRIDTLIQKMYKQVSR